MSVQIILPAGGSTPATPPVPVKSNLLRNSGFWFAQVRDPNSLTNVNTGGFGASINRRMIAADGWGVCVENNDSQYIRVDTDGSPEADFGGRYYGRFVKITSDGKMMITQAVESIHCQPVRGGQVRVQVWLKANVSAATWRIGVLQLTSSGTVDVIPARDTGTWTSAWNSASTDPTLTAGNNVSYIAPDSSNTDNTTVNGNALDCSVTTGWQRFGGTFTIPTDCHNLLLAIWSDDQVPTNDGVSIANAQVVVGTDIVDWSPLAISLELERCQRYILKTFATDTAPAQNIGETGNTLFGIVAKSGSNASALFIWWRFPVPLFRDALSDVNSYPLVGMTTYSPSAASAWAWNITSGITMGTPASFIARTDGTVWQEAGVGGGGGSGVGDLCALHVLVFGEL